jgi:hypothetical protein
MGKVKKKTVIPSVIYHRQNHLEYKIATSKQAGRLTLNGLHGVIFQKMILFITTAVKTSHNQAIHNLNKNPLPHSPPLKKRTQHSTLRPPSRLQFYISTFYYIYRIT